MSTLTPEQAAEVQQLIADAMSVDGVDRFKPIVALVSDAIFVTSANTITLTAVAVDNVGIDRVEFYRNGVLIKTNIVQPFTATVVLAAEDNGQNIFTAKAYDLAGNMGESNVATVTVAIPTNDTTPPKVVLTSSLNYTNRPGIAVLSMSAYDNNAVGRVELYRDGTLLTTFYNYPYIYSESLTEANNGTLSYMARAYDLAGNVASSKPVDIVVDIPIRDIVLPEVELQVSAIMVDKEGSINLKVVASDNVGIAKVELYKDRRLFLTLGSEPYEYSDNFTNDNNGLHLYYAKAYDTAGNVATSAVVQVLVDIPKRDRTPPTVSLETSHSTVVEPRTVILTANAKDNVGVAKVELYRGNDLLSTLSDAPYRFLQTYTSADNGAYGYFAKAYDLAGNVAVSKSIAVEVKIPAGSDGIPTVGLSATKLYLSTEGSTKLSVVATDDVAVTRVELYRNGIPVSVMTTPPYDYVDNFTVADNGTYSYTAKAYDGDGHVRTSDPIQVVVKITIPDTIKPTITLTASSSQLQSPGQVTFMATATDNVAVSWVEFYKGAQLVKVATQAPYVYTESFTAAGNGSYSYTAKAYDASGNKAESDPVPLSVNISTGPAPDTTPPLVTLAASSTNVVVASNVVLTASASDNIGVTRVELYKNSNLIRTLTTAPYQHTETYTAVQNGLQAYFAKAFDAAGNSTSSQALTVNVNIPLADTTAPVVALSATSNTVTASGPVVFTNSVSDNVGVTKVELFRDGLLRATLTGAPWQFTETYTGADNGVRSYYSKAHDAAGNTSVSGTVIVAVNISVVDTVPPTVSLTSSSFSVTTASEITLTATAADNVAVAKVEMYKDGTLVSTLTQAPYTYKDNLSHLNNGTQVYLAKAYDASGNSASSTTVSVLVNVPVPDTTAPTVTLSASATTIATPGSVVITATAADNIGVVWVEMYKDGALVQTLNSAPYQLTDTYAIANNGQHTYYAKAFDAAGNSALSSNVVVNVAIPAPDTTPPTVSLALSKTTIAVAGNVDFTITATDNVGVTKVELYKNSALVTTLTTAPYTYSEAFTSAKNGVHSYYAKAYDAADNTVSSSGAALTVAIPVADTTAPTVSLAASRTSVTTAGAVDFTATASDNVGVTKVEVYKNGAVVSTLTTSPYTYSEMFTTAKNGSHTYYAKAYDAAGNTTNSTSVGVTVNIAVADTTPPVVTLAASRTNVSTAGAVSLTATASDNVGVAKVELYKNNVLLSTLTAAPYVFNENFAQADNGSYTYYTKAYDAAGNITASSTVTVTVSIPVSNTFGQRVPNRVLNGFALPNKPLSIRLSNKVLNGFMLNNKSLSARISDPTLDGFDL